MLKTQTLLVVGKIYYIPREKRETVQERERAFNSPLGRFLGSYQYWTKMKLRLWTWPEATHCTGVPPNASNDHHTHFTHGFHMSISTYTSQLLSLPIFSIYSWPATPLSTLLITCIFTMAEVFLGQILSFLHVSGLCVLLGGKPLMTWYITISCVGNMDIWKSRMAGQLAMRWSMALLFWK